MVGDDSRTEALDTSDAGDEPRVVDDTPPTDGPETIVVPSASDGTARADRSSRLAWIVASLAVLIAVATVVVAIVMIAAERRPVEDLATVEQTAGQFVLDLTTWDASDGMAETRERLREAGTETFATDVDELFGGTDDLAALAELGARSEGEVRDVLVQALEGDEATALAVVVQRVTTTVTEGEEVSMRYALLTLRREDGDWRVHQVELIVTGLEEAATRTDDTELPGFGDAATDDPPDETTDEDAP